MLKFAQKKKAIDELFLATVDVREKKKRIKDFQHYMNGPKR